MPDLNQRVERMVRARIAALYPEWPDSFVERVCGIFQQTLRPEMHRLTITDTQLRENVDHYLIWHVGLMVALSNVLEAHRQLSQ